MKVYNLSVLVFLLIQPLQSQTDFSEENAVQLLKHLCVDIGPRPMGSPQEQRALQFAVGKFKEYGCDTAYVMTMNYTTKANTTSGVAVGVKRGFSKRIIVIGGHIDSAGPEIPGADDDASGCAVVMEVARNVTQRQTQSTIVFCCFGGEEQGLEGSKYFVDHFPDIDSVMLMLQVDMANGLGIIEMDPDTYGRSAPCWLVQASVEEFYNLGYENLRYPTFFFTINYASPVGSGSDHESFLKQGIPAIDFTTDVSNPIHTPRDILENFDPRGLKRSGDLVLKLIERFDAGVPSRETAQYLLYLANKRAFFIPYWSIYLFTAITIALAAWAFIKVRRRRDPPKSPDRVRWSGLKMWLYALIIVSCGWFSSDVIGLIKGERHPWFTAIPWYYLLAAIACLIGCWISLKLNTKLRLSRCPYVFYKRAAILLALGLLLFGAINTKFLVPFGAGLFLVSLATLVKNPLGKLLCVAFSPWMILRLMFSEWDALIFRTIAMSLRAEFGRQLLGNGTIILLFSISILPLMFALASVIRDAPALLWIVRTVRSRWMVICSLVGCIGLGIFLLRLQTYNSYWYRDVRVDQLYDMNKDSADITVRSSEYLRDLHITHDGTDTVIDTRTTTMKIQPNEEFDVPWVIIERNFKTHQSGDTTTYDVEVTLACMEKPFRVIATYSAGNKEVASFSTSWHYTTDENINRIEWFSFPDSVLTIPVKFQTIGTDNVEEKIEVTFNKLAYPMDFERELTYVIPRTKYVASNLYSSQH
ncbi:MAG: M28 family peptidase [Ignavibacteriae bacterium]|nr:M28 family peptidase [Ignavibacteriota bacterium]